MARIAREQPVSTTHMITRKVGEIAGDTVGVAKSVLRYGFRTFFHYETKDLVNKGVELVAYKALELSAGPVVSTAARYGSMVVKGTFDPYGLAFAYLQSLLLARILYVALTRMGMAKSTSFVSMII